MNQVTVPTTALLDAVVENRQKHRDIFLQAQARYRELAISELDVMLAEARRGNKIRRNVTLVEPQDHTDDYDRVIAMLGMSTEDEVTLSAQDFDRYVRDQWEWKQQSTTTNSSYGVS